MSEDEFAREVYPLVASIARRFAAKVRNTVPAEDLAQYGMMGALGAFRAAGERPDDALTALAAKRQILDHLRIEMKRIPVRYSLHPLIAENTPSYEEDSEARMVRRLDRDIALSHAEARERRVFAGIMAGYTLEEIGRGEGLGFARMSQIKAQGIARVRRRIAA